MSRKPTAKTRRRAAAPVCLAPSGIESALRCALFPDSEFSLGDKHHRSPVCGCLLGSRRGLQRSAQKSDRGFSSCSASTVQFDQALKGAFKCHVTSGVAQWLACWAHNPKVRGSKPRSAIPPAALRFAGLGGASESQLGPADKFKFERPFFQETNIFAHLADSSQGGQLPLDGLSKSARARCPRIP